MPKENERIRKKRSKGSYRRGDGDAPSAIRSMAAFSEHAVVAENDMRVKNS